MSEDATMSPSFAELLPPWVAEQRWYAAKGRLPQLRRVGGLRFQDPAGEVGIEVWLVADTADPAVTIYQVPLTYRAAKLDDAPHALVGAAEHSTLGHRYVYDGCHDPVFAAALLDAVTHEATVTADAGADAGWAVGHRQPGATVGTVRSARVLRGEQSNTSIIIETAGRDGQNGKPLIAKVFRVLHDGLNPDVVIQSALAEAGSTLVPLPVGALSGRWPDPRSEAGVATGHLAFVQEFLPGVEDAWRVALRAVADGVDFSERARALGRATAEVHLSLASALPVSDPSPQLVDATIASFESRLASAVAEVPSLAEHEPGIRRLYAAAREASWPALQRIHGDYHLGQVLDVPGRGWVLLDFEGEPMRPLAERSLPDLALRDVAGMLRSFDYAAGSWEQSHPGRSAAPWASSARTAFLEGYAQAAGRDPRADAELLSALEVDKALYEVVYEARNRPTWLGIPTTAITRLLSARRSDQT